MKSKFTLTDLEKLSPCSDVLQYARKYNSLSVAWDECERSDWMIWIARKRGLLDKPTSVKLACIFAKHVLGIYEKKYPDEKRPRHAIEAALKWLKEPTEENHKAAAAAAAYAADAYAAAAAYAARKSERKWQAEQIRKLVSNPFK